MAQQSRMTYPSVPWLISAGGCLLAAILALLLPETSGTTLPDVVHEAEVVGLAYNGHVIKSCYTRYGKTPYWTEVDTEASGGTLQEGCECNSKCRHSRKKSGANLISATEEHDVQGVRGGDGQPHSPASQVSSDSHTSLMSLVDVSRVNGNNSDTSDSSDHVTATVMGGRSLSMEKTTPKTADDSDTRKKIKIHTLQLQSVLPDISDEINDSSSERADERSNFSDQNKNKESSLGAMALCDGPEENDFSLSVFSLKFRYIKRPISPTERIRTDLHSSSSSSSPCTSRPRKTLIQEYISHHSFRGEGSNSCSSSQSEKECQEQVKPVQSIIKDTNKHNTPRERLTEAQKSSDNNSGNIQEKLKPLYQCNSNKTNTTRTQRGEVLPSIFYCPTREQSSSSVSPISSPEPKSKKKHSLPATRVSKREALNGTSNSKKGKAICNSPPVQYYF